MTATDLFEEHRGRLWGIAYRMLGSISEAEDIVQDVFEKWLQVVDAGTVDNAAAYLTTMTTRRSLDRLGSAQKRREVYTGPWLAEPVRTSEDPAEIVELGEAATLGFLHLLDTLSPTERAVHLLHTVFELPYSEIAGMVDKSESNCRQIARRARTRMAERRSKPWKPPPLEREGRTVERFLDALVRQDLDAVAAFLAPDAVGISDGGADRHAARRPVVGRDRLARFLVVLAGRLPGNADAETIVEPVRANNQPGVFVTVDGEPYALVLFEIADDLVERVYSVVNPDKLRAFGAGHAAL